LTQKNVSCIVRNQTPELAAAKRGMLRAQKQQRFHKLVNVLLLKGAAFFQEGVTRVFIPAAGKIARVVGVLTARHPQFIAIIDFGNAAHRADETESEFQARGRSLRISRKARGVVVVEKRNEKVGVWVERVLAQDVGQFSDGRILQK